MRVSDWPNVFDGIPFISALRNFDKIIVIGHAPKNCLCGDGVSTEPPCVGIGPDQQKPYNEADGGDADAALGDAEKNIVKDAEHKRPNVEPNLEAVGAAECLVGVERWLRERRTVSGVEFKTAAPGCVELGREVAQHGDGVQVAEEFLAAANA